MQKRSGGKEIKYLSLFSGVGGFELAIKRVFPKAKCVGFSEIKTSAINVYEQHFPEHINIGDIAKIVWKHDKKGEMKADKRGKPILNKKALDKLPSFDMLIGGSPCQGLSRANITRRDLADERSRLFYAFLAILKYKKPKYFLLENVASMSNEAKDVISKLLGFQPSEINSALLTAQNRRRLYWCNWKIKQPKDAGVLWKDIKQKKGTKQYALKESKELELVNSVYKSRETHWIIEKGFKKSSLYAYSRSIREVKRDGKKVGTKDERRFRKNGKLNTLVTSKGCGGSHSKNYIKTKTGWRLLTPIECARSQGFPEDWCDILSYPQACHAYGNAVTVDVIEHIMKQHPKAKKVKT